MFTMSLKVRLVLGVQIYNFLSQESLYDFSTVGHYIVGPEILFPSLWRLSAPSDQEVVGSTLLNAVYANLLNVT